VDRLRLTTPARARASRVGWVALLAAIAVATLAPVGAEGEAPHETARAPRRVAHVVAAGDIACDPLDGRYEDGLGTGQYCRQMATSELWVDDRSVDAALILGDVQYEDGRLWKFRESYDASWGRGLDVTLPAPGNHEYRTAGAAGYFDYFGEAAGPGWYSTDVGDWHVVSLNSTCPPVNCSDDGTQVRWLRNDLAADDAPCTLAFFHYPLTASVGPFGDPSYPQVLPFWKELYRDDADLILVGHQHTYERFARMTPQLERSPDGIRQFIVGTGGHSVHRQDYVAEHSQVRATRHGVLHLELRRDRYRFWFEAIDGRILDRGSRACV
jgi:hypothetical protein